MMQPGRRLALRFDEIEWPRRAVDPIARHRATEPGRVHTRPADEETRPFDREDHVWRNDA